MITALTIEDDRSEEQKLTHVRGVLGYDTFLTGWGRARNGASLACWAVHPEVDIAQVFEWVSARSDMKDVKIIDLDDYTPPPGTAHFHIYLCDPGHPATRIY